MYVQSRAGAHRIAVRTAGPPDAPPVVLLHGWAQSSRCWPCDGALAGDHRLLAADLRGHGDSDDPGEYADPAAWAADVEAVLAAAGEPAVLVAWSYGGLVAADYLRHRGTAGLRGLLLAGAVTEIGRGHPGGRVGPVMRAALPDALSEDPDVAVPALARFVTGMPAAAVPGPLLQSMLGDALRVPPRVRAALFARDVDSADVLRGVDVPTVLVHGAADEVVAPSASEYVAELIPGARLELLPGTGHLPFHERPQEFRALLHSLL